MGVCVCVWVGGCVCSVMSDTWCQSSGIWVSVCVCVCVCTRMRAQLCPILCARAVADGSVHVCVCVYVISHV